MKSYKKPSVKQRIERIRELIRDSKDLRFNNKLITGFKQQLKELQAESEADKKRVKKFNNNLLRELNLKRVGDIKPLVPQENVVRVA